MSPSQNSSMDARTANENVLDAQEQAFFDNTYEME
jgi:hypothetical protein